MPFRGKEEGLEWDDTFFVHRVINVFAWLKEMPFWDLEASV